MFHRRREYRGLWRQGLAVVLTVLVVGGLFLVPGALPERIRSLVGLGDERILPAVAAAPGGSHRFLTTVAGEPMRWNPRRPVRYAVNPDAAAAHWVTMVHDAVSQVEALTGLRFEYVGESDRRPGWEADFVPVGAGSEAPALIAWATADEVPRLQGRVAGLGGAAAIPDEYGRRFLARGGVTLDVDDFAAMEGRRHGAQQQRAVVLHEMGHLVGLDHVDDPRELMDDGAGTAVEFGPGDRAGLAAAGRGPCR